MHFLVGLIFIGYLCSQIDRSLDPETRSDASIKRDREEAWAKLPPSAEGRFSWIVDRLSARW